MIRRLLAIAVISMGFAAVVPCRADIVEFPAADVQLDIPDQWKTATADGYLIAQHPDKIVTLLCKLVPEGDAQTIGNNLPAVLNTWPNVRNVRISKSSGSETINDFSQLWYSGLAEYRRQDKPDFGKAKFLASVIDAKGKICVVGVFGAVSGNDDVIQGIFRSVKTIDRSTSGRALHAVLSGFKAISPFLTILNLLAATAVFSTLLVFLGKVPLSYNIRNLTVRWKTTIMTAMAFTLVVSLLIVMLGFVNGMYRLTEQSGKPENVIVLADGATDENFSNLGYSDSSDVALQPGVACDKNNKPLCSREVYIVVNQSIPVAEGEKPRRRFAQVRGLEDPQAAGAVHGMEFADSKSRWFSDSGVQAAEDGKGGDALIEAVMGQGAAGQFGKDVGKSTLNVGDTFDLGSRKWICVGITKSAGSTFDSEVWAKHSIVSKQFGKETFSSITVKTASNDAAKRLASDLTTDFKKASLQAQVETEYFEKLSATNQQFLYAIVFVAVVMAIGGVFGVMNTMFAAVSQRIKDIGVLRIVGYARYQVLFSFLLESILLGLVGGLLGCAIGYLANGWTASSIVSGGQGGGKSVVLTLYVSPITLAGGLLLALVMGALGGFFPALGAMRKRPLETLR